MPHHSTVPSRQWAQARSPTRKSFTTRGGDLGDPCPDKIAPAAGRAAPSSSAPGPDAWRLDGVAGVTCAAAASGRRVAVAGPSALLPRTGATPSAASAGDADASDTSDGPVDARVGPGDGSGDVPGSGAGTAWEPGGGPGASGVQLAVAADGRGAGCARNRRLGCAACPATPGCAACPAGRGCATSPLAPGCAACPAALLLAWSP
mmetsp:Transcript_118655/g.272257  ORF Transcript_118655/g.272257 Transcript_118655/m.272257 type:complete len:205 (-) Transcript_118655:854-1468(-)